MARTKGSVRPIRLLGDPVLRTKPERVESFNRELTKLVDDMYASMYAADGAGLAANQIGVELAVVVYDCADDDGVRHVGHVINPVLVEADGPIDDSGEGCLSLPGLPFDTPRYFHAVVEGANVDGEPVRVEGTGYFARCLQHEADHLDGHVFIDRLTGRTRRAALRAVRGADWAKR